MSTRHGKLIVICSIIMVAMPIFAQAKGTMRVQQADGSVQLYENVNIAVAGRQLLIETANKKGTLIIDRAACFVEGVMRCIPDRVQLKQNGKQLSLDFERGTVYFNTTDAKQTLRYSSTQLPPGGVLGSLKSPKGTYVTWSGTLDSYTK
ncbi:MAG TPA: hypothetical protein VMB20_09535 [Candidatus Acidoferrum sp.]|nr:hypothetical protein [Candidatus Acidoferrum sp.]